MDPLFWVAHGAIERLYQRVVFEGTLSDNVYATPMRNAGCSGHTTDGMRAYSRSPATHNTHCRQHAPYPQQLPLSFCSMNMHETILVFNTS